MADWSENAPVVELACPFGCDAGERRRVVDTVWEAEGSAVYKCSNCEIVFLHPIMSEAEEREFYEGAFDAYMKQRGEKSGKSPQEHFEAFGPEADRRLANLMPWLREGMSVLEVGSSVGFLLDAVKPHVASVQGVEPNAVYREYANQIGVPTAADISELEDRSFDLILAYYVVEHMREPVLFARGIHDRLNPGGHFANEVPNVDDALVRYYEVPAYDRFFWQKAHYFNYSPKTMEMLLRRAGFAEVDLVADQRYDISNHVHWMLAGKPGGKGRYTDLFDERLNGEYQRVMREHWLCDTIFSVATRGQ